MQPALTTRNKSLPAHQKPSLYPFPVTNNPRVTIILTTKYNSFPVFKHYKIGVIEIELASFTQQCF